MEHYFIFLAEFFHDFKNNLAIIKESNGLIQDIISYSFSNQKNVEILKSTSSNIDEQVHILNKKINIVDYYLISKENKYSLITLINDVFMLLNRYITKRQIRYEIQLTRDYDIKKIRVELLIKLYIIIKHLIQNCESKSEIKLINKEISSNNIILLIKLRSLNKETLDSICSLLTNEVIKVELNKEGILISLPIWEI